MSIKEATKKILGSVNLLEPTRKLLWDIDRRFGRIDWQIAEQYLSQSKPRKLHIGCGQNQLSSWLNADYFPLSKEVLHLDATQRFPFDDDIFDYAYSEHMIEHISYTDGLKMLSECYRVLQPSGRIRISTPDLAFLVGLYNKDKSPLQKNYIKWSSQTYKGVLKDNETFVINNFVRDWGHTFIYDESTLKEAMIYAGFTDITKCDLGVSKDAALSNLENEARLPLGFLRLELFILEGTKRIRPT